MHRRVLGTFCTVGLVAFMLGSAPTVCAQTVVDIVVAPRTLNLSSRGAWVTVHAAIPYNTVASASVSLDGVDVEWTKADDRGDLVAKFLIDEVKAIVKPGVVELTLTGTTTGGESFSGSTTIVVIAGAGTDLNGDGHADLLWESADGLVAAWLMDGTTQAQTRLLFQHRVAVGGWHVAGTGDFNGDGTSDLLWQSDDGFVAAWLMEGMTLRHNQLLCDHPAAVHGWRIVAAGDLDGDGMSDILWQDGNGYVAHWLMGVSGQGQVYQRLNGLLDPRPVAAGGWQIVGTGDLNGDGKTDILWQSPAGHVAAWLMDGLNQADNVLLYPYAVATDGWTVAGTADMNGDGKVDLLWQNRHTNANDAAFGLLATWFMDGITHAGTTLLTPPRVQDPGWKVVGPK